MRSYIYVPLRLLVNTLRYCLREIDVDPSEFSGHGFRRSGATFAHQSGAPPPVLMMGDGSSDAYIAYVDHATSEDLARLPRALAKACAAMA